MEEIYEYNGYEYTFSELKEKYGENVYKKIKEHGFKKIDKKPSENKFNENIYEYKGYEYSESELREKYGDNLEAKIKEHGFTLKDNTPQEEQEIESKKEEDSALLSTSEGEVGTSEYSVKQKELDGERKTSWVEHHFGWVKDFVHNPLTVNNPYKKREERREEDGITEDNISWVEESAYKFNSGLHNLLAQTLDIPKLIKETGDEFIKEPILNTIAKYAGASSEEDMNWFTKTVMNEIDKKDPLLAVVDKAHKTAKVGYDIAEFNQSGLKQYEEGIVESFYNGNISDGFRQLTSAIAETTPNTMFLLGTGGTGAAISATGYAAKTRTDNEELKEKGQLDKSNRAILYNAYLQGGFEYFADIFLLKVGSANKELFKKLGKKLVKEETENAFKEVLKSSGMDGLSEMITQIGQNASDKLVLDKDIGYFDGALDAGVIGLVNAGAMSSPTVIAYGANKIMTKNEQSELKKKKTVLKEAQKAILTETDKETITHLGDIINENTEDIKDFFKKKITDFEQIPDTEKTQLFKKIEAINKSKKLISNDNIAEPLKEFEQIKIEKYSSEITELLKNKVNKEQLLNSPQKPNNITDELWQQKKDEATKLLVKEKQEQINAYEQELIDPNLPTTLREQTEQKIAILEQEVESLQGQEQNDNTQIDYSNIKPIGKGVFGNIYTQFIGKTKEAIQLLSRVKNGVVVNALSHKDVGGIDLVWGTDQYGLKKIIKKHPEMLDGLQEKINQMKVKQASDNRIILESDTHKAVISKKLVATDTDQWLLTAYEKKNTTSASSSDNETELNTSNRIDTAPPKNDVSTTNIQNKTNTPRLQKVKKQRFRGLVERLKKAFTGNKVITNKTELQKYLDKTGQKIDNSKLQIIGEQGAKALDQAEERTHRMDNLVIARKMESANKNAKAIRLATGWERGAGNKWRYEISDVNVSQTATPTNNVKEWFKDVVEKNNPDRFTLGDLIKEVSSEASGLLGIPLNVINAYPELKDIRFKTHKASERNAKGFYSVQEDLFLDDKTKVISIREDLPIVRLNSILLHEIQHAIQDIEGFEQGGNPLSFMDIETALSVEKVSKEIKKAINLKNNGKWIYEDSTLEEILTASKIPNDIKEWAINIVKEGEKSINEFLKSTPSEMYKRLSGETEARNVQSRLEMTEEQRRNTLLSETEDIAREDQLFLRDENNGISLSEDIVNQQELKEDNRSTYPKIPIEKIFNNKIDNLPYSESKEYDEKIENQVYTHYLKGKNGEVYGAVFPDGTIYLDENKANFNTPIHEFAHVWIDILKDINKELHDTGIRLVKKSKYYKDLKKNKNYKHLTNEQIAQEALTTAIGDKGEHFWSTHKKTYEPFVNWLNKFRTWLTDKFFINQKEGVKDLTLDQFLDASLHDLLGGKEIKYNKTNFKIGGNSYKVINKNGTLTVENSRGVKVSKPTERKVLRKYAEQYDFTLGEKFNITDDIIPNENIDREIAQNSNNPAELAEVALRTKTKDFINDNSDTDAVEIIEYVQGNVKRGVRNSKGSDGSFVNQSDAKTYLKKDGKGLDVLAQELSEQMGKQITEQDIVDVILAYPNGVNDVQKEVRDKYSNPAKQRFTELTGLPSSDWYLNQAVRQDIAKENLNKEVEKDYLNHFSEEELLSLEQKQTEFKEYEKGNNQRDEVVFRASDTSQNESRPRVQGKSDSVSRAEKESNKQDYKTTADNIIKGSTRIFSPYFKEGRHPIESERRTLETTLILERNRRSDKSSLGSSRETKSEQENLLKQYAENEGILFSETDIINSQGNKQPSGKEADVYFSKNGKTVTKIVNYSVYSETPLDFLNNRISLFNSFFPDTAYTLKGFVETDNGLSFVLEQSLIPGKLLKQIATLNVDLQGQQKRVNDFMLEQFGMQEDGLDAVGNDIYRIMDLHLKNVIEGVDGNLYVIDAIPELKNKELDREFRVEQKSTLKKGSENLQALDDVLKQWEDKLNQFGKETLGMNMPVAVAQGMVKAMRLAVKTAKTTLDVLEDGRNYVRNTNWYKNLSETDKNNVEKTLTDERNVFNNMDKIIDDAVEVAREENAKTIKSLESLQKKTAGILKRVQTRGANIDFLRKKLERYIKEVIDSKSISEFTKSNLNTILSSLDKTKTDASLKKALQKIDDIVLDLNSKKVISDFNKILSKNTSKKVSGRIKANLTDEDTGTILKSAKDIIDNYKRSKKNNPLSPFKIKGEKQNYINDLQEEVNTLLEKNSLTPKEVLDLASMEIALNFIEGLSAKKSSIKNNYLNNAYNSLNEVYNNGRSNLKERVERRKQEEQSSLYDLEKDANPKHKRTILTEDSLKSKAKRNRLSRTFFRMFSGGGAGSLDYIATLISKKGGESRDTSAWVRMVNMLKKRETFKKARIKKYTRKHHNLLKRHFGSIYRADKTLNKRVSIDLVKRYDNDPTAPKGKNTVEFTLSQLLNVWMNSFNNNNLASLESAGFTKEVLDRISDILPSNVKSFGSDLFDLYRDSGVELNGVYESENLHSLNMPEFYAGKLHKEGFAIREQNLFDKNANGSINYGSLKARVKDSSPFVPKDVNYIFRQSISESSHYIAFAKEYRLLRKTLTNSDIRKAIMVNNPKTGDLLIEAVEYYIKNDIEQSGDLGFKVVDAMARNIAIGTLALKAKIAVTQTISIINGVFEMPRGISMLDTGKHYAKIPETMKYLLNNSEYLKLRYDIDGTDIKSITKAITGDGSENAMLGLSDVADDSTLNPTINLMGRRWKRLLNLAMSNVKIGDFIGVMGSIPVYSSYYEKYRKTYSEEKARAMAMEKFESVVDRAQQSNSTFGKSWFQKHPLLRYLTMYATSPIQNQNNANYHRRELIKAIRGKEYKGSKARNLIAFVNYQFAQPMAYTYLTQAFAGSIFRAIASALGFGGGSDDNDKALLSALILGNVSSVPVIGSAILFTVDKIVLEKEHTFGGFLSSPLYDEVKKIEGYIRRATESKTRESANRNLLKAIKKTVTLVSGVPSIAVNIANDWEEIFNSGTYDLEERFKIGFGYSKWMVDKEKENGFEKKKTKTYQQRVEEAKKRREKKLHKIQETRKKQSGGSFIKKMY